jgi:hypothetical protein
MLKKELNMKKVMELERVKEGYEQEYQKIVSSYSNDKKLAVESLTQCYEEKLNEQSLTLNNQIAELELEVAQQNTELARYSDLEADLRIQVSNIEDEKNILQTDMHRVSEAYVSQRQDILTK